MGSTQINHKELTQLDAAQLAMRAAAVQFAAASARSKGSSLVMRPRSRRSSLWAESLTSMNQ